jgi:hypothetical protein
MNTKTGNIWLALPYDEWKGTCSTLQMWMQIGGKIKLELCPFQNHWWHITYFVTARGMTSGRIPYGNESFEIDFDFIDHKMYLRKSDGQISFIDLVPCSVADYYKMFMDVLKEIGIDVIINTLPQEVPNPVPFEKDEKNCFYDKEYVEKWWKILSGITTVFEKFRSPFYGKASPVHFYWGSFDLSLTLYSGKIATPPPGADRMFRLAENRENYAVGFWAGSEAFPKPAFYFYMYPAPTGIEKINIKPEKAYWDINLREHILLYEDVIKSSSPEKAIMDFLESSFDESAKLAEWDLKTLLGPEVK